MNTPAVLVLLPAGFEEIELVTPVDLLRRAGARVTLAALERSPGITGRSELTISAETFVDDVDPTAFAALVIPGGPGVAAMREDGRAARLARTFADSGRIVAAICAAPLVLADAGLLEGRRFTAHFSTHLTGGDASLPVVVDGNIITSRGAGTAMAFALELVRALCGNQTADDIATAIML